MSDTRPSRGKDAAPDQEHDRSVYRSPEILWEERFEPLAYAASASCWKRPGQSFQCGIVPKLS